MSRGKYPECSECKSKNNKLACLLTACEIRDRYDKEMFARWQKEWEEAKICFGCKHCKVRVGYMHSYKTTENYCELTGKPVFGDQTCSKFEIGRDYDATVEGWDDDV